MAYIQLARLLWELCRVVRQHLYPPHNHPSSPCCLPSLHPFLCHASTLPPLHLSPLPFPPMLQYFYRSLRCMYYRFLFCFFLFRCSVFVFFSINFFSYSSSLIPLLLVPLLIHIVFFLPFFFSLSPLRHPSFSPLPLPCAYPSPSPPAFLFPFSSLSLQGFSTSIIQFALCIITFIVLFFFVICLPIHFPRYSVFFF